MMAASFLTTQRHTGLAAIADANEDENETGEAVGDVGRVQSAPHQEHYFIPPPEKRLAYTALHQAILDSRFQQVRLLVDKCSAKVDSRDLFGRTPLMLCSLLDDETIGLRLAKVLLRAGASLGVKDHLGRTALVYACIHNRQQLAITLLKGDLPDVGEPDNDGNTALHHAAQHASPNLIAALLDTHAAYGTTFDPRNSLGYTPLLLAAKFGRLHAAGLIVARSPASANLRENQCFLNALEWLRRSQRLATGKKQKRQRCRQQFRQHQAAHLVQMRPTFLTERGPKGFTNFYKEITCPALRSERTAPDFHATDGLPRLPAAASKIIESNAPTAREEQCPASRNGSVPPLSRLTGSEIDDEPPPNVLAMNEDEVRRWLFEKLENSEKATGSSELSSTRRSAPPLSRASHQGISLSRPLTRDFRRVAPPSVMSSTQSLRYLFRIYCDAVNAQPPAIQDQRRSAAGSHELTLPNENNESLPVSAGKRASIFGRPAMSAVGGGKNRGHK